MVLELGLSVPTECGPSTL